MLYPIYVHLGDENHAHGITFPDFEGCFSAVDHIDDLPQAVQEAVSAHYEGSDEVIPLPSDFAKLQANPEYQGGIWMLADIDLNKINVKAQRINITIPANLLAEIDQYTQAHNMSRSAFLALAASKIVHTQANKKQQIL